MKILLKVLTATLNRQFDNRFKNQCFTKYEESGARLEGYTKPLHLERLLCAVCTTVYCRIITLVAFSV